MISKEKFGFFKTKEVKPKGWLDKQIRIQANGLCGNLHKVWPDVRDSAWIGGDREGWERVPYWLDGYIPMAYLLEDEEMINVVKTYMDHIISSQHEDGWICPCSDEDRASYDKWVVLLIAKVLVLYADCSGEEERIIPVLEKCLKEFELSLDTMKLNSWGAARWFEGLIAIYWLYERTGDEWLIELAKKLEICGTDWKKIFEDDFIDCFTNRWELVSHIVNIAMVLKSDALMSLISGNNPSEFADRVYDYLMRKHSTAFGHFNGDECLSGSSPIHGAELCSVVETMYSYEILFKITGEPKWLDRLETLCFNALPSSISPDMWSHQYVQMANQIQCTIMEESIFRTNFPDSHTFGLEPNFGCCTANFGQGWPKFILSAFAHCENSIVCCMSVPAILQTKIGGVDVNVECITQYPFRNTAVYVVEVSEDIEFELKIRIPASANSAKVDGIEVKTGAFTSINKKWSGRTEIKLEYEFTPHLIERPSGMKVLFCGPLLYTVKIEEEWIKREYERDGVERKYPYCDYDIYPKSDWNYAFASNKFEIFYNDFENAFYPDNPPIYIKTDMSKIPWNTVDGHCLEKPESYGRLTETEKVILIPYGCSNLKMTELPDESSQFEF